MEVTTGRVGPVCGARGWWRGLVGPLTALSRARLEAAAQLVEHSGEMLGLVTAPVGGQLPGVNTHADR